MITILEEAEVLCLRQAGCEKEWKREIHKLPSNNFTERQKWKTIEWVL